MNAEKTEIEAVREFARSESSVAKTIASEFAQAISRLLDIRTIDKSGDVARTTLARQDAVEELNRLFVHLGFDVTSLDAAHPAAQRRSERRVLPPDSFV